jgi:hypothetical protein
MPCRRRSRLVAERTFLPAGGHRRLHRRWDSRRCRRRRHSSPPSRRRRFPAGRLDLPSRLARSFRLDRRRRRGLPHLLALRCRPGPRHHPSSWCPPDLSQPCRPLPRRLPRSHRIPPHCRTPRPRRSRPIQPRRPGRRHPHLHRAASCRFRLDKSRPRRRACRPFSACRCTHPSFDRKSDFANSRRRRWVPHRCKSCPDISHRSCRHRRRRRSRPYWARPCTPSQDRRC